MNDLTGKTIIITGSSRGIGREIALRCARDGANIVIAAKSDQPHPKLPGTIHTVAEEVEQAGGKALAIKVDVRSEIDVLAMAEKSAEMFGGIDALINNAGAIRLTGIADTPLKRFDLMHAINERAVLLCSQAVLPYLKKAGGGHIITLSPPLNMSPEWLGAHIPYTVTKYGMTLMAMGLAAELRPHNIAVNSLWPRTVIATSAVEYEAGGIEMFNKCRKPEIVADAAYQLLISENCSVTGRALIDDDYLAECGVTDFSTYAYGPGTTEFFNDLYVD